MSEQQLHTFESRVEIVAVLVSVANKQAEVLTLELGNSLPHGPLDLDNPSLQKTVRQWVYNQTKHPLGYIEQLYTFINKTQASLYHVLVGYLGLVKAEAVNMRNEASWIDWYTYFPWEDHRKIRPSWINKEIIPLLKQWLDSLEDPSIQMRNRHRVELCWGINDYSWNEEYVLQRYELLYEAGLVPESIYFANQLPSQYTGKTMVYNGRRILSTAMARLRAKIKYRPVIFELMPEYFTLLNLQDCVEALSGIRLHKQNFRRWIDKQDLVEPIADKVLQVNRGRPAQMFRFKENVLLERDVMGSKLPQLTNK